MNAPCESHADCVDVHNSMLTYCDESKKQCTPYNDVGRPCSLDNDCGKVQPKFLFLNFFKILCNFILLKRLCLRVGLT